LLPHPTPATPKEGRGQEAVPDHALACEVLQIQMCLQRSGRRAMAEVG
jgi:hypothetical protein